ncbi:MAG: hypothetical protein HON90_05265, partial [Halobacteriovoraceae bacterium]|nr:hypothetical protein [Halobacteriovoraceae bacterium]
MKIIYTLLALLLLNSCEMLNLFGGSKGSKDDDPLETTNNEGGGVVAPTGLTLSIPSSSPTLDVTPEITVAGVESGDTVKIYTDSACTTEVATGTASGTTINLTLTTQSAGSYTFYTKRTQAGTSSACSTASVALVISSCPTNFVPIPHNTSYTNSDFCVAKYEMKDVAGTATSQAASTPEISVDLAAATTSCSDLGVGYTLISNSQWQTIARNIEAVASNWDGGVIGTNNLNTGHSDNDPAAICDATQEYINTDCSNSGSEVGFKQKRTHTLSNTEVIWDFSGNVSEWVIDTNTGSTDYGATAFISAITSGSHTATGTLDDSVNRA